MNLSVPLAIGKSQRRLSSLGLVIEPVKEKENSEFKPAILHLKIDLMSHHARDGGDILKDWCSTTFIDILD